ncbi:hypothetical protein [uncultured Nevskia sp.]|uniref:hypothetical protein n=1 Tax=uncultured Nevskia sp. TaxID=228950 RepID=UPI0025EA26BE|nr:hypothetical protein [uncultured Nevskia sp.]
MSYRRTRLIAALIGTSLVTACAPLVPQRGLDHKPQAELDAAARIAVFPVGGSAPPASAVVVGPVEAHSCQFWEFADSASPEDAIKRLQFAALEKGANGIIEESHAKDEKNRWASRCWESYVARGTAVKFDAAVPLAAAAAPLAATSAATAVSTGSVSTLVAAGEGRTELMDWIRRLAIPRGNFIARGPADGNLDWIGIDAEIGAWQVQLPRATGSAAASSKVTDSGIALVPGISRLTLSSRQLGYEMTASWTYTAAGTWEMGDRLLRRL